MIRLRSKLARTGRWTCLVLMVCATSPKLFAEPPLHERIDQVIEAPPTALSAGLCSDAEFLRRIYLDLTGSVPSVSVARAFLEDKDAGKRAAVVDRLLASAQFARHMATTFDVMLTERRPAKHVKQEEWSKYLYDSFSQNKPWNQLAREILAADGSDEKIRPAARFYLDREGEPNLVTRDIGRLFFGMDLACCQCHDHPLVATYLQSDYYGIYAFVSRGQLFTDAEKKVFYAEKADGDAKFTSVFTKQQDETRPCLPGEFEITEPVFFKGEEYTVAPADKVRPVPKFSRRAVLADSATNGGNRQFNRNIANRLWAALMGRGLVEPLDMHHLDNPSVHPELLDLLADELARMKFDMRAFIRELALSRTYQRSLQTAPELTTPMQVAAQQIPGLESQQQQLAAAIKQTHEATVKVQAEYNIARKAISALLAEVTVANNALGAAQKAAGDATKALSEAQQQLVGKRDVATALNDAAAKATEAAAKLAGDQELAQAAEKFKTRAGQLAGEVTTAEKLVADRTAVVKTTSDALAVAQSAATQVAAKLPVANQQAALVQQQLASLRQKSQAEAVASQTVQVRLRRARTLAALGTTMATAEASRIRAAAVPKEIEAGKQTLVNLTAQLPQLAAATDAAQRASEDAVKQVAETQKQTAERQLAAQLFADALAKADVAVQKLPKDAELKQAADVVKSRREKLQAAVGELQKVLATREQSAKVAGEQLAAMQQSLASAKKQMEDLQKSLPEKEAQLPALQSQASADQMASELALNKATEQWSQNFSVSALEPLTPEQMTWSILTATGVIEQQRAAAEAEVNKTLPIDPKAPADPAKLAEREKQINQQIFEKLKGNVAVFVGLFGHAGGQSQRDFFATVDQALFFANAGVLQGWLNPGGENLLGRLMKMNEPQQVAAELYLSVLTRLPSAEEVAAVKTYLQPREKDRQVALQELAWALITSNEFRFSY